MLRFNAPAILLGVMAAMSVVQGISEGKAARNQANANADFDRFQAEQDALQARRDVRDEKEANRRTSARTRAVLAAQGVDLNDNTALSLVADVNTESAIRQGRIKSDSQTRQLSLRTRAANTEAAGKAAQSNAILGGVTKGLGTFAGGFGGSGGSATSLFK